MCLLRKCDPRSPAKRYIFGTTPHVISLKVMILGKRYFESKVLQVPSLCMENHFYRKTNIYENYNPSSLWASHILSDTNLAPKSGPESARHDHRYDESLASNKCIFRRSRVNALREHTWSTSGAKVCSFKIITFYNMAWGVYTKSEVPESTLKFDFLNKLMVLVHTAHDPS